MIPQSMQNEEIGYDEKFIRNYERRNKIMGGIAVLGLTGLGKMLGGLAGDSRTLFTIGAVVMAGCIPPSLILGEKSAEQAMRYHDECAKRQQVNRRFRTELSAYGNGDFVGDR